MDTDLPAAASESTIQSLPPLTKTSRLHNSVGCDDSGICDNNESHESSQAERADTFDRSRQETRDALHPYVQVLSATDVDSCTLLEEAAFPPSERASREKFLYRLSNCGEICLGLFTSHTTLQIQQEHVSQVLPTVQTAQPVQTQAPERKAILLAHISSTLSTEPVVTDAAMALPPSPPSSAQTSSPVLGHDPKGRTICLHSLAVLPAYQKLGLGTLLLRSYLARMAASGVADRVAIIAHEALIPYYERFGFVSQGPSAAQFGGGGWFDMVHELKS